MAKREHWGGRVAFILAAIGSAVGLGNLWGFPYKLYAGGGGAFLVPYFLAMFVVGIPLLLMEYAVGHWAQNSPPGAFGRILGKYRFVGWWLVSVAFVIITYYTIILGYSVVMLWDSLYALFVPDRVMPWQGGVDQAKGAFFGTMLNYESTYALSAPRWPVLIGMLASWGMIYFSLFRGVKWVSKVVLFTVPLPWIMLLVLTLRGLTLEGATTGLHYYLEPDWSKLGDADTWRLAFSQVFFSLSLGFAVMMCYASFLHRKSDINNNAAIVALGDLATSFIAGLAVFSVIGNMAMLSNKPVQEAVTSGPGLAFAVYPYALSQLPAGAAAFSAIFFMALLTLGIDSAFSIVEAVQSSINDNAVGSWRRSWTLPSICGIGAIIGVLYTCGKGGLNWLGLADDLVNGPFGILSVALAETLVVGWAWGGGFAKRMREHANERSDWSLGSWWDVLIRWVVPVFLLMLIAWSVSDFIAGKPGKDADTFAKQDWIFHLIGHIIFAMIPLFFVLFIKGKTEHGDEELGVRKTGTLKWILALPLAATSAGIIWGLTRMAIQYSATAASESTERVATVFEKADLGLASFVVLTIAFLSIFGGLIWCFARAIAAAGSSDVELMEE
ncbi:MAG: sodium-dependent transporter [Chitinivibrionales bacterium]|nr:sodium-dependent transporter [Chitinivibrionales bacterium]